VTEGCKKEAQSKPKDPHQAEVVKPDDKAHA